MIRTPISPAPAVTGGLENLMLVGPVLGPSCPSQRHQTGELCPDSTLIRICWNRPTDEPSPRCQGRGRLGRWGC